MTRIASLLLLAALAGRGAWAQRVQNMDISYLFGPAMTSRYTIPGSDAAVRASAGLGMSLRYGYQLARLRYAGMWLEVGQTYALNPTEPESIAGLVLHDYWATTVGLRFMFPLHERVSVHGSLGGGFGSFRTNSVVAGLLPYVRGDSTFRGVADVGGGVSVRLTRRFSLRGEVRDLVTGRGLSGSVGRHHVLPLVGVALHF